MKFLIQQNLMSEEQLLLTKKAVENLPHEFIGLIPFSREITANVPLEGVDFIPYGSTLLTTLGYELKWKGCHFDLEKFNYGACTINRSDMLNDYLIWTMEHLIPLMETRPADEAWFIRPSADLKQFSGQVMNASECAAWLKDAMNCESSGSYKLEPTTPIVAARPQNIQAEWRWFIVGSKVVDGSMYRAHGQLQKKHETDKNVIDEAQEFADKWLPDPNCVMDLALLRDGEVKVIEFNCINSSGFYGHDVNKIFKELYDENLSRH